MRSCECTGGRYWAFSEDDCELSLSGSTGLEFHCFGSIHNCFAAYEESFICMERLLSKVSTYFLDESPLELDS